jgi:hypothetical protein
MIIVAESLFPVFFLGATGKRSAEFEVFKHVFEKGPTTPCCDFLVGKADRESVTQWGCLSAQIGHDGPDIMIAATAMYHGYMVVTRNIRHFSHFPINTKLQSIDD